MTHATKTGAINRLRFLTPVFGAAFFVPYASGTKILATKINTTESDIDDEFAVVTANIIAGVEVKGKLKRNKSQIIEIIISVTCTPLSGLE